MEWINVKDYLPASDVSTFCYGPDLGAFVGYFCKGSWEEEGESWFPGEVTHWAFITLPAPSTEPNAPRPDTQ
jgi:hypothetical protein